MDKIAFFKLCLKEKKYEEREWVISAFSVPTSASQKRIPFEPYVEEGKWVFNDGAELQTIDEKDIENPLLDAMDEFTINTGDLPNVNSDMLTCVGNCIANAVLFVLITMLLTKS